MGLIHSESNAHNADENINLEYAKGITKCLSYVLDVAGQKWFTLMLYCKFILLWNFIKHYIKIINFENQLIYV